MQTVLKNVVIDVLAEKVQDLEWELHSKNLIIEDLEKQLTEYQQKELEVQMWNYTKLTNKLKRC